MIYNGKGLLLMRVVNSFIKIIVAGIVAIIVLSFIFTFYNLMPVHISNQNKNTDYIWTPNSHWIRMTEGISHGKFDANGFNNISVIEEPDIIILGSSHIEAVNVNQEMNTAYLLGEYLNGKYSVYNMGISGHHFAKVCQYLPTNLALNDKVPKAVIIETSTVYVDDETVKRIISGSVEFTKSYNKGLISTLQKVPYLRNLYQQIEGGLLKVFMPENKPEINDEKKDKAYISEEAYDKLFTYIEEQKNRYNSNIIIFYHPMETINEDGSISFENDESLHMFEKYADKHNINFIDMTEPFIKMYNEKNLLPHGFITGRIGEGHLNKYGHYAIAESLYDEITKLDEEGKLCR